PVKSAGWAFGPAARWAEPGTMPVAPSFEADLLSADRDMPCGSARRHSTKDTANSIHCGANKQLPCRSHRGWAAITAACRSERDSDPQIAAGVIPSARGSGRCGGSMSQSDRGRDHRQPISRAQRYQWLRNDRAPRCELETIAAHDGREHERRLRQGELAADALSWAAGEREVGEARSPLRAFGRESV